MLVPEDVETGEPLRVRPAEEVIHSGAVAPEFIANCCEAVPFANLCNPDPSL